MRRAWPTVVARCWHRLVFRWRRAQLYRELTEELAFHTHLKERERPEAAMGNTTLAKEECRDMWSFVGLERAWQDVRYAVRMFGKTPVFTGIAVMSLALGIGGNAAMFSLANALLVKPLPYSEPERLVRITGVYPRAAVRFFQQQSRAMDVAAVSTGSELNLTGNGMATRVSGSSASANFLSVLGASVERGRGFEAGEDLPGRDAVAILSDALWKNQFGSDPAILGRVITLNGIHRQVVGVMPAGFSYPAANVQLWIPLRLDPANFLEYWAGDFVPLVARLHAGATMAAAQSELRSLVGQFRSTFPYPMSRDWNADSAVIPLQRDIVGDIRGKLILLLGSVAMVLLIACTNVASLLLSRATTRRKEIALRAALGAGRLRIVRQLLTESMALAIAGAAFGIVLGMSSLSIFKALLPASTPGLQQAGIDWHVAGAVAALAVLTGLAFGLSPALSAAQVDLTETIKTGSPRSTGTFWTRLRSVLIAAEVALTLVLVVGAGLLLKSLYKISEVDPGFDPAHILTVRISPDQSLCARQVGLCGTVRTFIGTSRSESGVSNAAVANSVPLEGDLPTIPVDVEDHPKSADHPAPMLWFGAVSADYRGMMRIPLIAGRDLTRADGASAGRVVLISASTAKHFWPHESAIGKHLKMSNEQQWRTIVGVVGDVKQYTLTRGLPAWVAGAVYMPYAQSAREDGQIPAAMTLLVKTNPGNADLSREIERLAKDQAPNAPVGRVQPLENAVAGSIAGFWSILRVFLGFAGGGDAAGGDWNLRADVVLGEPTDIRDWVAGGDWGYAAEGCFDDSGAGSASFDLWGPRRHCCRAASDSFSVEPAVWSGGNGCGYICSGDVAGIADGGCRDRVPRLASRADRSGEVVAGGMIPGF